MSLKIFHIVFVVASIVMSAVVGAWGITDYARTSNTTNLAVGVVTLGVGVALVWYSRWFLRKIRAIEAK